MKATNESDIYAVRSHLASLVEMRKGETNGIVQALLMKAIRAASKVINEPEPAVDFDEFTRMPEKEAMGRMLKAFHRSLDEVRHVEGVEQDRLCIFAKASDVYAFCLSHPRVGKFTAKKFTPRGFSKALKKYGLVLDREYEKVIEEKRAGYLLAFDVEAIEEFFSLHVPAID